MNELSQDDMKELDLLVEEARQHTFNGNPNWSECSMEYLAWRTRANAILCKILPRDSPDLKKITAHKRQGCCDLSVDTYVGMVYGAHQYFIDHRESVKGMMTSHEDETN